MMRITVLGKSPSWQDAGGACSGYLIEDGDAAVLLDCGNGAFAKLRLHRDYVDLDAVVISHLHADHFLDLVPYAYALTNAPRQQLRAAPGSPGTPEPARPQLVAPPGARDTFRRVVGAWGNENLLETAFRVQEYVPEEGWELGPLRFRFAEVPHFTTTFAVDVSSANGNGRLTYGADSRPAQELVEIARETDLLIAEATLPQPERDGERGHMTPAEAGELAKRAGARRLVLTHISDEIDEAWALEQGRRAFGGPIELAREGAVYEL
jgi:ribonuclease BN (tRNA processing enzyme)